MSNKVPGKIDAVTPIEISRLVYSAYSWAGQIVKGKVVDLGCGNGYGTLILMASQDVEYVLGIDIMEEAPLCPIAYACMDIEALARPDANWIICFYVLEHLPLERQRTLIEKWRSWDCGIILATNVIGADQWQLGPEIFVGERQPDHIDEHTPESWRQLCQGAQIVGQRYMGSNSYIFHDDPSIQDIAQLAIWWPKDQHNSLFKHYGLW